MGIIILYLREAYHLCNSTGFGLGICLDKI